MDVLISYYSWHYTRSDSLIKISALCSSAQQGKVWYQRISRVGSGMGGLIFENGVLYLLNKTSISSY